MKYRSQWPTFILRSHVESYWLIIQKYDVHTSNSLQDIRQNHWTVKYGSCWPSLHDPQVNVTRLIEVEPPICLSCFHNRKTEKNFNQKLKLKISKSVTLTSRSLMWVKMVQHKTSDQYLKSGKVPSRSIHRFRRYRLLKTLTKNFNILSNADKDAATNADAVVTAIALPVLTYRRAKNET